MLNIITKRATANTTTAQVIQQLGENDAVLLMSDGVYCQQHTFGRAKIYVIDSHRSARGLPKLKGINYIVIGNMVELSEVHTPILTW